MMRFIPSITFTAFLFLSGYAHTQSDSENIVFDGFGNSFDDRSDNHLDQTENKNAPVVFDLSTLPTTWKTERVVEPHWQSELFVVQAGLENRQTVLLVHGLGQAGFTDWLTVIPVLEKEFHVIAIDLPGFGRSSKPKEKYSPDNYSEILAWIINQYAHNPVVLVGHSMGGSIALQHAADYPDQVERLILVDAAGILERTALLKINGELPINLDYVPKPLKKFGAQLLNFGRSIIEWTGVTPDPSSLLSESNLAWNTLFNDRENGNAALALIMHNFSGAIQSVQQQTYLIWGANDRIAPLRTGKLLAGRMKNAQLLIIEGAEHVPMKSHTAIFNQYLLEVIHQNKALLHGEPEHIVKKGVLRCNGQHGVVYSGSFDEVIINECTDITLKDVSANRLRINNSLVDLYNVTVNNNEGQGVSRVDVNGVEVQGKEAVIGVQSVITATNAYFVGEPSILSIGSRWDLAGTTIESSAKAIEVKTKSRFVFSVSDLVTSESVKNLHQVIAGENIYLDTLF